LLCLIDDAQWLDRASAQVLGFAARRLRAESVALVFPVRGIGDESPVPELAGLPELQVTGLPEQDARTLLALANPGPSDDLVLDRIIAESQGNPLALLELPRGFTSAELAGGFGLLGSDALPRRIEESFRRQTALLSPMTRQVLLVAAAEPVGEPVLVRRAVDQLGIGANVDLAFREAGEQFLAFGSRVTFRHPLLRSAIYRAASPDDRRRAHWALAQATDAVADPDRRAWHLAQAATTEDEDVAAELERSAGRAQARGGPAAAAAFFERAAELTPDPTRRGQRLLAAAQASYEAGMSDAALWLVARAEASPLAQLDSAQVGLVRARVEFTLNRGPEAPQLFLKAAAQLEQLNVPLARETYLEALRAGWFVAHLAPGPGLYELSAAALAAPASQDPHSAADLLLDGLSARYGNGYPAGAPLLKQALETFVAGDISGEVGLRWLWFACTVAMDLWDEQASELLTTRFVELARESGALTSLPLALTQRVVVQVLTGELGAADGLLAEFEGVREGMGIDEPRYAAQLVAVWRGQERQAAALIKATAQQSKERGEGAGLIAAGWMQALLSNSLGRYDEAFAAASRATEPDQEMGILTWCSLIELVTAAAHTGQQDMASQALERLTGMTQASGTDWALGLQARCQALVGDDAAAEPHYREAIERLGRTRIRGELARTHLDHGEWLRRNDRRDDARAELHTAHGMFMEMGMEAFAARAARELGAAGEVVRRRVKEITGQLTAQEGQIVRLVRDGLSNTEVATRLFISPRTVEWHLGKIFGKLGITSRRQLRS
jgi:DNA-binding CsgD family transcriptional regulator/tetratricopeptide (TPR) repeat protein